MPTDERLRGVLVELAETLEELGYEIDEILGPVSNDGEEVDEDTVDSDTVLNYFIMGAASGSRFYIVLGSNRKYGEVVYPFDVRKQLATNIQERHVDKILGKTHEWGEFESDGEGVKLRHDAIDKVIENTRPVVKRRATFNLSAYASTAVVDHRQGFSDGQFPVQFQCLRAIFPFSEQISLKHLDDTVHPVLIAGERGRRYVESAFTIADDTTDSGKYEVQLLF